MLRWVGLGILGKGLIAPSTKLGHRRRGHRLRLVAIAAGTKAGDESLKNTSVQENSGILCRTYWEDCRTMPFIDYTSEFSG